ncbi:MAG TPA: TonB-dependent receptor [Caulobacteraceae bacterium]
MKNHILLATCAASALTLAASGVLAQAAPTPPPAAQAQAATTLGEIVVTAERREANLQDVPESVTAFTSHDRDIKGISTVQDMTNFTPGFTYSSQLDRPAMRGLSRNTNIYAADSSVGVYYDDFFSNSTFLVGRDDMLIDQVEILIGPQGTLYGRNAIGGLINTISKKPTEDYQGEMRVSAGNYGSTKVEGTIAGPLIFPNLYFRLSAYDDNQNNGYLRNLVSGMPTEGGVHHDPYVDLQLEYKTDHDDLWLDSYVVGFNHDRGGPGSLLGTPTGGHYDTAMVTAGQLFFNPNFPYGGGAVPGSVVGQIGTDNPNLSNIRDFAHSQLTDITLTKAYAVVAHYTHHFDGFDMKYIGGYSQYHYELHTAYFNNDNSPITQYQVPVTLPSELNPGCGLGVHFSYAVGAGFNNPAACVPLTVNPTQIFSFTTTTDWFSHELLFQSTRDGPVQWVAGLYYYNEWDNNPETIQEPGQPQIGSPLNPNLINPANLIIPAAAPNPSLDNILLDYQDRIQSLGEYAQIDWKILPTLKLTGGLRYTQDWKHAQEEARFITFGLDPYAAVPALAGLFTPQNFGSITPAFDVTSNLTDIPSATNPTTGTGRGICSIAAVATSGPYAGDAVRCLSDHSSALTGTAGIEWTPDPDTLIYARYNRGYKAFALNAGFVGNNPEAASEHVNDYEIGFKKTFGRTLVIDADAFYYDYTNDQVPVGIPVGAINLSEFISIPKAVSDGVELQAIWNPIRPLTLSLTYGLNHTRIQSTCSASQVAFLEANPNATYGGCVIDTLDGPAVAPGARPVGPATPGGNHYQSINGYELPQSPENKIAFNATYTLRFDPGDLTFSGTYIWKDKSFASVFQRPYYEAPSWSQVDLRATWAGTHDRYEVVLFVKNVFNTLGYDAAAAGYNITSPVGGGNPTAAPAYDLTPPRLYGVEVHYKF